MDECWKKYFIGLNGHERHNQTKKNNEKEAINVVRLLKNDKNQE